MKNDLRSAIEVQHGGRAVFRSTDPVDERHDGRPVWQGEVHVFDLEGHPKATRAYAWSSPVEVGSASVLCGATPWGIRSAADAVRAAIVAEHKR